MRFPIILLILLIVAFPDLAIGEDDYTTYHREIADAERTIFIERNITKGLIQFKGIFSRYDFVFVDDCLEALQLSVFSKNAPLAKMFALKAIDNGFDFALLKYLRNTCHCSKECLNTSFGKRITILDSFYAKNKVEFDQYKNSVNENFLNRINKEMLKTLYLCHGLEQMYKQCSNQISNIENQSNYTSVNISNFDFIIKQAKQGVFFGSKNLGIYNNRLGCDLYNTSDFVQDIVDSLAKKFFLKKANCIPISRESDYFGSNPQFIIWFHYPQNAYSQLMPFFETAVRQGFWHPREIAFLKSKNNRAQLWISAGDMILEPDSRMRIAYTGDTLRNINELRRLHYLPEYEIDYQKLNFQHEHNMKLFFGFLNATN